MRQLLNRLKRQLLSHVYVMRALLAVAAIALVTAAFVLFRGPISLVRSLSSSSLPSHSNRTNFLLLGVAGGTHESPNLTDTIIFVSISPSSSPVLLTIPRDFWVPSLRAKVNTAYHYGVAKAGPSGGLILAKSAVSEVIDQPVDFAVVFDFATFSRVIDEIGGIDVRVERTFTDAQYPIAGKENDPCDACRYETITFSQGLQHMDGATALKFVRSRHSEDLDEGTDFARSRRQTLVIGAIKTKLLSKIDFGLYRRLIALISQNTQTDVTPDHYTALAKLAWSSRQYTPKTAALTEPDHLYNPPLLPQYGRQWILLPRSDDPTVIYNFVSGLLK
ncbi:LCP family protein [Candidatus Amesbacteria bacterium]|nr:LCP family protein [Candidatus Amesbacteria bacterium]